MELGRITTATKYCAYMGQYSALRSTECGCVVTGSFAQL